MYEVKVVDRWDTREKWVYVFQRDPRGTHLLRIIQEEQSPPIRELIYVPDGQIMELDPTFKLDDLWIDQLLEQLSGTRLTQAEQLEEAYLHERGRVDKLIDYATQISIQVEP